LGLILSILRTELAWPFAILFAWFSGEFFYQKIKLPRISGYAMVGFLFAPTQFGFLPELQSSSILLLANLAFGLILFECGYRINLQWLRKNPWIAITSLTESMLTFAAVYAVLTAFGLEFSTVLILSALSMATSPATVLRIINEQRSSGQVTERILHLSTLNSIFATITFKIMHGFVVFQTSGSLWEATYSSFLISAFSVVFGWFFGMGISAILRITKRAHYDSTLIFTIAVVFLVAFTQGFKLSPILSTLSLGLAVRQSRIILNASQRGFGALGDLLSIFLFVFVASTLEWKEALSGFGLAFLFVLVRQATKLFSIIAFAKVSGITVRKGAFIGMASAPFSTLVILLLEQTKAIGFGLEGQLGPLVASVFILEVLGPICVQKALIWAQETQHNQEG
jgi:Kef-type K+ transport system membrane component KefB